MADLILPRPLLLLNKTQEKEGAGEDEVSRFILVDTRQAAP